jgi:outer membrane autotransporter protein
VIGATRGQYDGWQANGYIERGLSVVHQGWNVQPYGALQYLYLRQGGLQETGGGMLNLAVSGIDAHSLRGILGGRFSTTRRSPSGLLVTPEFRAAWLHEFLGTEQSFDAGLAQLGGSYTARGVDLGRDWVNLGGGVNLMSGPGSRLFAGYDLQFNAHQAFHVGSAGMEFTW